METLPDEAWIKVGIEALPYVALTYNSAQATHWSLSHGMTLQLQQSHSSQG